MMWDLLMTYPALIIIAMGTGAMIIGGVIVFLVLGDKQ